MTPYCTPEDLAGRVPKNALVELVSDDRQASFDDPAVQAELESVIRQARDKVDTAVGAVAAVPVSPVTTQVKVLTIELACCYAFLRRPPMPEGWGAALSSVEATLRAIAKGDIPVQFQPAASPLVDKGITVVGDSPLWDGGFWKGYGK